MNTLHQILILFVFLTILYSIGCKSQTNYPQNVKTNKVEVNGIIGGGCDGCELLYEGKPTNINAIDTNIAWFGEGQKLVVTGTVFLPDGLTPAKDVILYYWQTDHTGHYSNKKDKPYNSEVHGYIRGWMKTNNDGKYMLHTTKPAPYPGRLFPAHIHIAIKEPALETVYYIDDLQFDNDSLLPAHVQKYPPQNRGGNGIVKLQKNEDIEYTSRDIILGKNIPNYPIPN
ncbi:MAG: intradiol ring-cleavage dioxygenase [Saprospiraceae bacterium]